MNILMTCFSRSWGGMEMFVVTLSRQLITKNINVTIAALSGTKIYEEAAKVSIPLKAINSAGYFKPGSILKIASYMKKNSFDIIHSHYSKDLWTLVPALKLSRNQSPLVLTKQLGSFIKKKDLLHKILYKRVNKITAISTVIKNNLLDTCPVTEDKIRVIYNAVDTNKFDPSKANRIKVREEFKIGYNETVIGMSARFTAGKGYEEFLHSAKILDGKFDNLKFVLVGEPSYGEDDYGDEIKKLVDELNLNDKVIFTGFRTDMPDIYSAMDIFAFPSHSEAFGMALTEAMALNKPVVASNSNGVLDIVEDGKNGLLFQNKNVTNLTEKLEQLITSEGERENLGTAARKTVVEKFDLDKITNDFTDLYKSLMKEDL